jgi:chromosome segregation ATPase
MNSPGSAKQPSNDKGGGGRDGGGGGGGDGGAISNEDVDILRKEYRNMQANRNAFAHESELVLRRQQATLDKLREENKTLKDDVARIQTRHMTRPINNFEQSQLDRLYQELDKYSNLVESEKAKAAATENEITKLRDDIWTRRQEMGGVNAAANNQRVVEKQVRLLESQLDQALVKFNKCVSRNKRLREEIDGLRGERVTFEKVYRKVEMVSPIASYSAQSPVVCPFQTLLIIVVGCLSLSQDLRDKKKHMALVIEQSNKAYEERDKAQLEIVAIERLNRKEEDSYHQQIMDLAEELDKVNEQLLSSTKRGQTATVIDPEDEERTAAERREFARATEVARAEEEYAQQCDEKLRSFEDAFREISTATGISDVDELVQAFIENEEQNFSLFRYSNEQASEIERLEDDIQSLREEEMRYKASASDTRKDDVLKLQNDIHSIDELTKAYESKCERYQNILDEVKDEIKVRSSFFYSLYLYALL